MGQNNDPHYGETSDQQPHMGEPEEPQGTGNKQTSTGTGTTEETGADMEENDQAGQRPTGSGGSAPMTENM
jgi:hypothetical protein